MRIQIDSEDQSNLGERKEIEYLESIVKEKKKQSSFNFEELFKLREIDAEIDSVRLPQWEKINKLKEQS